MASGSVCPPVSLEVRYLVSILRHIEWAWPSGEANVPWCRACGSSAKTGHSRVCPVMQALIPAREFDLLDDAIADGVHAMAAIRGTTSANLGLLMLEIATLETAITRTLGMLASL